MKRLANKKLAIVVVGIAVLAGAGGAVAATQGSSDGLRQAYLNDLANRLGVSSSTLTTAMKAALDDQINAAVTAGRLTQTQANALEQRIAQSGGAPFLGRSLGRRGLGVGIGSGLQTGNTAAAQYLGISKATLRTDLQSGKSLAQITASIPSKTVTGLEAAITAADKTRVDTALANGRITTPQEQQILSELSSRLDALVQRSSVGAGSGASFGQRRGWRGLFGSVAPAPGS